MVLKFLLLICYIKLLIVVHSTMIQSRYIVQKRNPLPCLPQNNRINISELLQLENMLIDLQKNKDNTVGNLEVSYSLDFVTHE